MPWVLLAPLLFLYAIYRDNRDVEEDFHDDFEDDDDEFD